jgi:serine/threonine protein kinase
MAKGDWVNISEEAKDLIRNMLKVDPNERISLYNCLKHKWIIKNSPKCHTENRYRTNTGRFLIVSNNQRSKKSFNLGPLKCNRAKSSIVLCRKGYI